MKKYIADAVRKTVGVIIARALHIPVLPDTGGQVKN